MDLGEAAHAFREFLAIIKRLRTPGTGCPWDLAQDHRSLRPFLIEEAYEVLDALDSGNDRAFREELGDLLLQVVLHAQVADDRGAFSITEVIHGIEAKMVRRHPHVFGSTQAADAAEVVKNWDQIKAAEAAEKGHDPSPAAALARLPEGLPALQRAQRLGEKAAKHGFEAGGADALLDKTRAALTLVEEEARSALPAESAKAAALCLPAEQRERMERTMGEILFNVSQLARCVGVSAEDSLRACNKRFVEQLRDVGSR